MSVPHMPCIVPHIVPRVGRSYEHFQDGFEFHLLRLPCKMPRLAQTRVCYSCRQHRRASIVLPCQCDLTASRVVPGRTIGSRHAMLPARCWFWIVGYVFSVFAFCVLRFVFGVRVENVGFRISDLGFGLRVKTCDAACQVLVRRSIVCRCSGLST